MSTKNNLHVVSRGVAIDKNHILLCKTIDLPLNFYFLPGGHIEHGESAQYSLIREMQEETGARCTIKRFLGCLEYSFEPTHSSICHNHEYNFIFEIESNDLKLTNKIPQLESHIQLLWIPLNELSRIDFRAKPLQALIPKWLSLPKSESFESEMM